MGPRVARWRNRVERNVRQQLAESGMTANANQATLTPTGLAMAPIDAPPAVQE